jgi:hypothetical protein
MNPVNAAGYCPDNILQRVEGRKKTKQIFSAS